MSNEVMENDEFLDEYAGNGFTGMSAKEQSIPYLGIVQPASDVVSDTMPAGHWRNSATGEDLGQIVSVIPLDFKTIWNERSKDSPYNTVARYEPRSIPVNLIKQQGGKGYPEMINPASGNKVQELYVYAVLLAERPQDGILYLIPTVSSLTVCRGWNRQLHSQKLQNGAQAPIFAYAWDLVLDLVDNPKQKNSRIAKLVKVQRGTKLGKEVFTEYVKPQLENVQQAVLAITSGAVGDDVDVE